MTLPSRIIEKWINAALVGLLFLGTGFYSCASAQALNPSQAGTHIENAEKVIRVASEVKVDVKAVPLNKSLNSPYAELKPAFAPNGNRLYFSRSFHPGNTSGEADQEDIWYSEFDYTNSSWSEPIRMLGLLNNEGPNFIENVSMTGDTIILGNQYLKKGKMRAGVSYSVNVNGEWIAPRPIFIKNDYNISNHENHFVNLKNGIIISAVKRSESVGGRDLFVSFWNGEYATEPVNMGSVANSDLEESSPYMASDNKTLFFASKGHNGYGGYDIFMSERLDDSWTNWTVPTNLGPAVNGSLDEEFFTITHCGRYALFSKQVNIHNVDLFKIPTHELFGKPLKGDISPANKKSMTFTGM